VPVKKHQTTATLDVELTFEVLPELEVNDYVLPPMLNIIKVMTTIVGPNGKPRVIDITNTFSEQELMLWEDEIIDTLGEPS